MQIKDPKPEIMRLEELALMVRNGEIKLPKFQRPFVWKPADMLKLLDSIYKGYPIGSILIWNSSQKLISERSISGFEVNSDNNNNYPTNYLLDGQQRLTTLCGALFWNGGDEGSPWNIHFDLDAQEFRHAREKNLVTVFPLNRLIETSDFIRQCMKFDHHIKRDEYFKVAERLLKSIKDYKIAVVKIGDMTIEEVAPIFERINSTGRQLTIVDLMMAATWSNGFDLNAEIHTIRESCREVGFEDLSDQIILRSIAAAADLGVNKEDIQKLRAKNQDQLKNAAAAANDSLVAALVFLRDWVGIQDFGYIPYTFQLTYLAEFFRISKDSNDEKKQHLKEWFWYTSVTRYFGTSSSTGQVSKDVTLMRNFAQGRALKLFETKEIEISRLLYEKFSLRTAASTTFALLLHDESPNHTIDGRIIDSSHRKLKTSKIFSSYSPLNGIVEKWNIAKILYPYGEIATEDRSALNFEVMERHLLDKPTIDAVLSADVFAYLEARSAIVAAKVNSLTNCPVRYVVPTVFDVQERPPMAEVEELGDED